MPHKSIVELHKDIQRAKEGKLFKSAGRGARVTVQSKAKTLRLRTQAESASMHVRFLKGSPQGTELKTEGARIQQKAALKGVEIPEHRAYDKALRAKSAGEYSRGLQILASRAKRIGLGLGRAAGKVSAVGQILTLPSQIEEYKEMMKPLHKREAERGGRRA